MDLEILWHEIANDLQVVRLYTEMIKGRDALTAVILERLDAVDETLLALSTLKKSAGQLCDVVATMEKCCFLYDVVCIIEATHRQAVISKELFFIVLRNLVTNSKKYGAKDLKLYFRTFLQDNNLIIYYQDNGSGIADKYKEAIFKRGFRIEQDSRGKGLGLFITKKL